MNRNDRKMLYQVYTVLDNLNDTDKEEIKPSVWEFLKKNMLIDDHFTYNSNKKFTEQNISHKARIFLAGIVRFMVTDKS